MAETIPLVDPQDDGTGLAMSRDDCCLSVSCPLHECRQRSLGVAQLNLSHVDLQKRTNVVILCQEALQNEGLYRPATSVVSELFGYARGAFSGASREHIGLFERADGGTLFLDEIGELPLVLQPKILRAIQDGEIRRLGSNDMRTVDVRIVAATHRNLREMVATRTFRNDLFYRLRGYVVRLPPLRERGRDVVHLARRFLRDQFPRTRISREAEAVLRAYAWPGNVRELQHVVRAAGVDAGRTIRPEHLAGHLDHRASSSAPRASRTDQVLAVVDWLAAAHDVATRPQRLGRGRRALSARQQRIMRQVEDAGRITRLECANTTGASLRTASRDLRQFVERGYLIPDGRAGNAAGYRLARPRV